jgi:hypothetical protein
MMDFLVREARASVDGPMLIVRYGSCGGLRDDAVPGTVAANTPGAVYVSRNYDAFTEPASLVGSAEYEQSYLVSKVALPDAQLAGHVRDALRSALGERLIEGLNASADSFYGSQGRHDGSFDDRNDGVVERVCAQHASAASMEMESFQCVRACDRTTDLRGLGTTTGARCLPRMRATLPSCPDVRLLRRPPCHALPVRPQPAAPRAMLEPGGVDPRRHRRHRVRQPRQCRRDHDRCAARRRGRWRPRDALRRDELPTRGRGRLRRRRVQTSAARLRPSPHQPSPSLGSLRDRARGAAADFDGRLGLRRFIGLRATGRRASSKYKESAHVACVRVRD